MKTIIPLDGPYIQYCGKKMLNFSSYDFLGLAQHPEVKKSAIKYTLRYGAGTPASSFCFAPQQQLEEKLAHYLGMETATFFPCIEGATAALAALNATITSSLSQRLTKSKTPVCIDDTETFGILGSRGFGLAAGQKGIDFILGSFAKGCGSFGAYIATSQKYKEKLPTISHLPPSVLGAIDAAFNFIPEMDGERQTLTQHTAWLKSRLEEKGWKISHSELPIVTLSFQTESEAEKLVRFFEDEGIFVGEVDEKQISFLLTALHTPDDLDQLGLVLCQRQNLALG